MPRAATDADFNKPSRFLEVKLELYFYGLNLAPLTIQKSDYLVDVDWLEEGSVESTNPFGNVSSNEISFRLYNRDGMFSPTNAAGPYYGRIKAGVPVKIYIRPLYDSEDVEWLQLGQYNVTGWDAAVTGSYADVVANDAWHQIFNSPMPNYPISLNKTYKDFLTEFFSLLGIPVTVDALLTQVLPYAFVDGTTKEFIQAITAAALSYVTSNKAGVPVVGAFTASGPTRAVLTDADQIKSVTAKQSIIRTYDGVDLKYNVPQVSAVQQLVNMAGLLLQGGDNALSNVALSATPLWQISSVNIKCPTDDVVLKDFTATQTAISMVLYCALQASSVDVAVYGKIISLTEVALTDMATKLLPVKNKYIQTATYANRYKSILSAFVTNATPTLSLSVRGNPLLNIGDKVVVQSTKYNLYFTGIIQRMSYKYAGALSCDMVLLNTEVLQGVS